MRTDNLTANGHLEIGRRIAELRKVRELTQTELGNRIGISQSVLASYETGRRSLPIELLPLLAEHLQISVEELFGLADHKRKKPGPPSQLEKKLLQIQSLPHAEQQFVSKFLDKVLADAPR